MKRYLKYLCVLAFCLFAFSAHGEDVPSLIVTDDSGEVIATSDEQISHMDIEVNINPDATVSVVETVDYDFSSTYKHGIFRIIPLGFRAKGEPTHTKIHIESVTDESGNPYEYKMTSDDPVNVRIGNADTEVTGKHIYKISYTLKYSIGYFDVFDEWYWNLTGNDWPVPIKEVTATVTLPQGVAQADLKLKDYCGTKGATVSCGTFTQKDSQRVFYKTNTPFDVGEGATIAIGFPKGLVTAPKKFDIFTAWLAKVWFIPFPFLFAFLWFRKRFASIWKHRKFFKKNVVVAEYDAGTFGPLEVALLVNKRLEDKDLSALIVSLAIRGYIKIENKDGEFCFTQMKDTISDLSGSEILVFKILDNICESGFDSTQSFAFTQALYQADSPLVARDYMQSVEKGKLAFGAIKKRSFMTTAFVPLFLAVNPGVFLWLLSYSFLGGMWLGFMFSGTCVLIAILNSILPPASVYLTEKGFEAERKLRGLKLYIKVAEEERIKFANAPAKTPELFEKLLPYAIVFGLEKKWAKEFEGLYAVNPSWYSGSETFSSIAFISAFSSIPSSISTALAPTISSIGSSSSSSWSSSSGGSSGGGSSGGGGGGGGGGSW